MISDRVKAVIDQVDHLRYEVDDHWQIPRDEASFLAQLVWIGRCASICEIGTSYGFSTLHLALAASELGGHVHSIDQDPRKLAAATKHLEQAGLARFVTLHQGDARLILPRLEVPPLLDFVFIDATKAQCGDYLDAVGTKLATECMIVTDNTRTHAQELDSFVTRLRALADFTSCEVPIGNGLELTVRRCRR
jgi:predicted O-methyltransferase YrrM